MRELRENLDKAEARRDESWEERARLTAMNKALRALNSELTLKLKLKEKKNAARVQHKEG